MRFLSHLLQRILLKTFFGQVPFPEKHHAVEIFIIISREKNSPTFMVTKGQKI